MTLILNEIHVGSTLADSLIVAAADSRITVREGRSYHSTRKKLFEVPYINGAVSYFGAAIIPGSAETYLSDWIPAFINHHSDLSDIGDFAAALQHEINRLSSPHLLAQTYSGFHICGYRKDGYPDFWYFSNIGKLEPFRYADFRSRYFPPESHYLGRDAITDGWDGRTISSLANAPGRIYRNGDFRVQAVVWDRLDEILTTLNAFKDFPRPTSDDEIAEYVRFKFEFIAYLYKKRAKRKLIGTPIDVLLLRPRLT